MKTDKEQHIETITGIPIEEWAKNNNILDIKKFAKEISQKLLEKRNLLRNGYCSDISDAVRQMIEHKMNKEGWTKQSIKH